MGTALAALLNGRARKVTPAVVRALRHALPDSTILVSEDLDQARRHVRELIKQRPEVILSGGGDGAAMRLLNLWREGGGRELPIVGILRLGTGNAWARGGGGSPRRNSPRTGTDGRAGTARSCRCGRSRGSRWRTISATSPASAGTRASSTTTSATSTSAARSWSAAAWRRG